jgi:dTDP-glucose pyrophosphorylase
MSLDVNCLVLCAGNGSRFADAGYELPKPLIDVGGESMLSRVYRTNSQNRRFKHYFAVRTEHIEKYQIDRHIRSFCGDSQFIEVDRPTEGACCTALLAKEFINNHDELIIYNSDQLVNFNPNKFRSHMDHTNSDIGILTFRNNSPKWSFCELGEDGYVKRVVEKEPISDVATCGWYWWRRGSDFVRSAEQMIANNDRTKGEFYLVPSIGYLIAEGKKVSTFDVDEMIGLGTPLDLHNYLETHSNG